MDSPGAADPASAPRRGRRRLTGVRLVLAAVALALGYAGLYKLVELGTSFGSSVGAAFWPASGLTVSVLLLRPRREWPAYLAAIFVAELLMDLQADFAPGVSVGMAVANTAEPLVAALLVCRLLGGRAPDLSVLRDLTVFLLAAGLAGPAVGATIGSVVPWALGVDPLWPRLGRWFVGDALGVIVIAPAIVSLVRRPRTLPWRVEESWTFGLLAAVAALALGPWDFPAEIGLPFLVVPVLAVVAIRGGTQAAAVAVLGVAVLVETVTTLGAGPFAVDGAFDGLVVAQLYLATCAATALVAAALMAGLAAQEELALSDSLTGLANRRLLHDRIAVACRRLSRQGGRVGLLFVDLDGFKRVNDRLGHVAGDRVLVETGRRLVGTVREQDTVARLGGDEFVILVDGLDTDADLKALARRVEEAIEAPMHVGSRTPIHIGASIGVVVTDRPDADPQALLTRADRSMYDLKQARRRHAARSA